MKFFKKKSRKHLGMTTAEIVAHAGQRIEVAMSVFSDMNNEIQEINETLENVVEEETRRVTEIEKNKERALAELQANKALQEQLKPFIR